MAPKKKKNLATEQQQQWQLKQECLEGSAGSVPGDLNKAKISIKGVTKFWFPSTFKSYDYTIL